MILDQLAAPVVLAPLGGGPSTPELAAAVSGAGGLGFLAAAYLTAEQTRERIAQTRALTDRPFGVNVFAPVAGPAAPDGYSAYAERVGRWASDRGLPVGEPRFGDDDYRAKLELLAGDPPAVVSFTFGCPTEGDVARLRAAGSEVWVTVTTPEEAGQALACGSTALVVQGAEAGGHRAGFADADDAHLLGLLSLLQLIASRHPAPLVASGAIATGGALAGVLCAGAAAAQIGTAFMLCPEAGTGDAHRRALASSTPTALTRAFTGRTARGVRNAFMAEHPGAPAAYPEIHNLTAPLRRAAREAGDASAINLWAGETHELAREQPAAEVVRRLTADARTALARAGERLDGPGT